MQAAKFTEQLILLLTGPTAPPPPAGAAASAGANYLPKPRITAEENLYRMNVKRAVIAHKIGCSADVDR